MAVSNVVPLRPVTGRGVRARHWPARLPGRVPIAIAALATAAVGAAGFAAVEPLSGLVGGGRFQVCGRFNQQNCVIDGDTIRYGGMKVRLADIDAPEVFSPKCRSEAELGARATRG